MKMRWRQAGVSNAVYGLMLVLAAVFLLNACAAAAPGDKGLNRVAVEALADILPAETADVRQAADSTLAYYQAAGLQLQQPVTIVLARDRKTFLAETMSRFRISELEVQRVAKGVDALAGNGLIVMNMDGIPTPRQRTFLVAHELTHQVQRQLAGTRAGEVKWLMEGMAESIGAQVSARQGFLSVEQYKANWQNGLRAAVNKPQLAELANSQGWSNSLAAYGSGLTYKTAGLGALVLSEQHGMQSLIQYFAELGNGQVPAAAFRRAFGVDLFDFEGTIDRLSRTAS